MATAKKISQMTPVSAPLGTDVLAAVQSSTTKKLTVTQALSVLATVSQAEAEAGTATTRRAWTAVRVKQAIEALAGGGGTAWEQVTGADTIAAGEGFLIIDAGGTFTITIAATIAANEEFIIHNSITSTGVVSIEPNTGHTIKGPLGDAVGGTDTITIAPGETIKLVASDTALLHII